MKQVNVAIMGLGTVGGGTYKIIVNNHDSMMKNDQLDIQVKKVLELNVERALALGLKRAQVAANIDEIASDPEIDTVVEVMGGVEPAKTFILKCLAGKKNVVTANKELVAKHWSELEAVAKANGVGLYIEATCVGGVPIIRTLMESMQANDVQQIMGIYNGTTNYILTKMSEEHVSYSDALKEAQKLGYAEANPTNDVDGYDSMYKLSILSSLSFHTCIPHTVIYREGISKISAADIESGRELGYAVKLLAIAKKNADKIEVRVHPTFVPFTHPLATVRGSFNAVHIVGDNVGDIMLYGRGAGDLPTGSAIVSDIAYAAKLTQPKYTGYDNNGVLADDVKLDNNFESKYYFLAQCRDNPGVLGKITTILGKYEVSLDSVIQRSQAKEGIVAVVFLTHMTREKSMLAAIEEIGALSDVSSVDSLIRVI